MKLNNYLAKNSWNENQYKFINLININEYK